MMSTNCHFRAKLREEVEKEKADMMAKYHTESEELSSREQDLALKVVQLEAEKKMLLLELDQSDRKYNAQISQMRETFKTERENLKVCLGVNVLRIQWRFHAMRTTERAFEVCSGNHRRLHGGNRQRQAEAPEFNRRIEKGKVIAIWMCIASPSVSPAFVRGVFRL